MSVWCAAQKEVVTFLNLLQRKGVVVPRLKSALEIILASMTAAYEVTGISPQSITLAQELNGFACSGTLYPPLNPILREPLCP